MSKLKELCNTLIFYQDEADILDYEECFAKPRELYKAAREEIRQWLEEVIRREVNEKGGAVLSATLFLPMESLTVRALGSGPRCPEMFYTPIGIMDEYVYNEILKDGNPVKQLFDFIHEACYAFEMTLVFTTQEAGRTLITEDLLSKLGWKDPLGIHKLFPLMHEYEAFMSGTMYSK